MKTDKERAEEILNSRGIDRENFISIKAFYGAILDSVLQFHNEKLREELKDYIEWREKKDSIFIYH